MYRVLCFIILHIFSAGRKPSASRSTHQIQGQRCGQTKRRERELPQVSFNRLEFGEFWCKGIFPICTICLQYVYAFWNCKRCFWNWSICCTSGLINMYILFCKFHDWDQSFACCLHNSLSIVINHLFICKSFIQSFRLLMLWVYFVFRINRLNCSFFF